MTIYLSSGMSKFGIERLEEGDKWRKDFIEKMMAFYEGKIDFFNPNKYFSFADKDVNEREAMNYDLYRLHHSDLVVYNATDPNSLGSMAEIGIAYDRNIPVLVLNENGENLHPWITNMAHKIFNDMDILVDYIMFYFL